MMQPPVTICVPCYNAAKTIALTLESLLKQEYPAFTILVCDNSSKDATRSIVESYDPEKVRYILNSKPGTAEDNWNYCLSHVSTDHFCLYHADDLYDSKIVSEQVNVFLTNDVSAVFTMSVTINEDGTVLAPRQRTEYRLPVGSTDGVAILDFNTLLSAILKNSNFVKTPTLFTTRQMIAAVGKFRNEKFRSSSDLDLWLRMAKHNAIAIIAKPLHKYRVSNNQGSYHIYNNRVHPQDYFTVIDFYISNPGLIQKISPRSLVAYRTHKGVELIECALNAVRLDNNPLATEHLKNALSVGNFVSSFQNYKWACKYLFGLALRVGTMLGLGKPISKAVAAAYKWERSRWAKA